MAWPNQSPPGSNPSSTPEFTPPAIVALASGIIMFLASILPWVKSDLLDLNLSAWTQDLGLFPVATFVPLAGLATAGLVAARLFMKDKVPSDIVGFSLIQIQTVLAFFTLLLALGYLLMSKSGFESGIGLYLNLLGAIGLMAAAVMEFLAAKNPSTGFAGGQTTAYGPPPQQNYAPPGAQQYPQQPQPGQQPYPPQQQPPRPQPQQGPPRQQPPPGQQGYPPPPQQQGGNWPQQ